MTRENFSIVAADECSGVMDDKERPRPRGGFSGGRERQDVFSQEGPNVP